ncbi:hypothetical protein BGW80DRAFT_1463973 [Lactifluus volemus]|nr:hypothetical protein BGW80DRAFT_1463973 [Lactifluus volemus]
MWPIWSSKIETARPRLGDVSLYGLGPPVIFPSNSLHGTMFPGFGLSPTPHAAQLNSPESGPGSDTIITHSPSGKSTYADPEPTQCHTTTAINWQMDEVSANVPSFQGHQCKPPSVQFDLFRSPPAISSNSIHLFPKAMTQGRESPKHVDPITPTPHFSNRWGSSIPYIAQYEVQRASRDRSPQIPRTSMGSAAVPLSSGRTSLGRSPCVAEDTKGPYSCKACGKMYAQSQGLSRHRRETHGPKRLCAFCGAFKWRRRYMLKRHLKSEHPDLDADEALEEATRACPVVTVSSRCPTPLQASPSKAELNCDDSGSQSEASRIKCSHIDMEAVRQLPKVGVARDYGLLCHGGRVQGSGIAKAAPFPTVPASGGRLTNHICRG